MGRKITDGLRLRKDGLWELQKVIDGKRKSFSSREPRTVWDKYNRYMQSAKERKESSARFETVAKEWWEEHSAKVAYGSLRPYAPAYRRAVECFGSREIAGITPAEVNAYVMQLAQKYAYKTVANHLCVLKMIFVFAIIHGAILTSPCVHISVPPHLPKGTRKLLTPEQLTAVKKSTGPNSLLAKIILYTGARCGEALALQWQDVDFDADTVTISKAVVHHGNAPVVSQPKTAAGVRTVPLLSALKNVLLPFKGNAQNYIIGGKAPLTKSALNHYWREYTKSIGIGHQAEKWVPGIDRHSIRHEYATMLYEAGIDESLAQSLMGHADIITTKRVYTHIRQTRIALAKAALEKCSADAEKLKK